MTDITRHPLIKQAYDVCQAIEACGASIELTAAVTKASALMVALDKALPIDGAQASSMNFGQAIESLKLGKRVARAGWNGKGMWLALSPGSAALPAERFWAPQNRAFAEQNGPTDVLACITMKTANDEILMGWLASQTDMLADDWAIV